MHRIPVGVLGASGYAGRELCTLISEHPGLDLAYATANAQRGERMAVPGGSVTFIATEDAPISKAELVFSSLPHGASAEWVARVRAAGRHRAGGPNFRHDAGRDIAAIDSSQETPPAERLNGQRRRRPD